MDMFSLRGKVAALSGASTGIGRHMAGTLAAAGAKVVLARAPWRNSTNAWRKSARRAATHTPRPSMYPICRA